MIIVLLTILLISVCHCQTVCGYDGLEYSSKDTAHSHNTGVMHCGNCGKCSNIHDISIYKTMDKVLTSKTAYCSFLSIFGRGRSCMKKHVGFTSECLDCWMENIKCTRKHCATLCIIPVLFKKVSKSHNGTMLNKCLQCDEDKCGPAFKKCAGANRRRCGIATDIARPDEEMCTIIDPMPVKYFMAKEHYKNDDYDYNEYDQGKIDLI